MRNRCVDCNKIIPDLEYDAAQKVPHCECGGLIRPDVVWFGELLPEPELRKARQVARTCDVFLSVGTSAQVQPAASLPLEAHDAGAYVVEINLEPTFISDYVNVVILGQAGAILPQLVSLI
jgi:NAD-dependent deacetylase